VSTAERPRLDDQPETQPRLYLACPLTGLGPAVRRQIEADVAIVKHAILNETHLDRIDAETWPLSVYAPIEHTSPWKNDGLAATDVYRRNLRMVHDSDALIVLAEKGGSAGVGQETEWASRLGLPIAFLCAGPAISRQIAGCPGLILVQSYNKDAATLEDIVKNFVRRWKPVILDGPRRRASRIARFEPMTLRLRGAWQSCRNRTDVAAQIRVDVEYLELTLSDPRYVAVMPTDTIIALSRELNVPLGGLDRRGTFALPVPMLRALIAVAAEDGWADDVIEALIYDGRAAIEEADPLDLKTVGGWRSLRERRAGG
jgi:hypothetical protein